MIDNYNSTLNDINSIKTVNDNIKNDKIKNDNIKNDNIKNDNIKNDNIKNENSNSDSDFEELVQKKGKKGGNKIMKIKPETQLNINKSHKKLKITYDTTIFPKSILIFDNDT